MIKGNTELASWVMANTQLDIQFPFVNHIYSAITGQTNKCANNNVMPYKNIKDGFGFCGSANACQCCKESVSNKVKSAKAAYSESDRIKINAKRKATTLELHGVTNNGQTPSAIAAHKSAYQDTNKVAAIVSQIGQTKLTRYGNATYNNSKQIIETNLKKYGVTNTWSLAADKQNPNLVNLKDKTLLAQVFPKLSVTDIAALYNVHVQTVYHYLNLHGFREPYKSTFEQEIVYFLKSLGITNIVTNNRTLIGKELDIFLPDYNLAIEFNGVYWHHDQVPHVTKTYHYDKFIKCEEKGILLLTIFSNSWEDKKDIWKQKIANKLLQNPKRVYARATSIVKLTAGDTATILNNHHVQGYCPAQHCYGLKYNNEIVAVMTFSNKRAGIGKQRGDNAFELVRFVTTCSVVGGASKLLAHFVKQHQPATIFSYSDNQYSTGNLYKVLGFAQEQETKCGYWYYDPSKRKAFHRYSFTKFKLVSAGFDPDSTEKEIMNSRGFLRIWDCGTRTWVLNLR